LSRYISSLDDNDDDDDAPISAPPPRTHVARVRECVRVRWCVCAHAWWSRTGAVGDDVEEDVEHEEEVGHVLLPRRHDPPEVVVEELEHLREARLLHGLPQLRTRRRWTTNSD
jgi:hypothetical protein